MKFEHIYKYFILLMDVCSGENCWSSKADVVLDRQPIGDNCMAIIAYRRLNRILTIVRRTNDWNEQTGHCRQLYCPEVVRCVVRPTLYNTHALL